MKNTKTKIILSAIILSSVVGFVGTVDAAGASLYVSPASLTKTVGNTFSVSVGFNASGSKVCAVEGTLVFKNLSCQSITVAGDVTPQSSPTCSNPYFLIGVPSCATTNKVLFTVSTKAGNAGIASISFTGVDIIGEGLSVGSASISGNYTINAIPKATIAPTPISASTSVAIEELVIEVPASTTPSQVEEVMVPAPSQPAEQPIVQSASFLAAVGNILTLGTGSILLSILVGLIILLIVAYVIYGLIQRKRKNLRKIK